LRNRGIYASVMAWFLPMGRQGGDFGKVRERVRDGYQVGFLFRVWTLHHARFRGLRWPSVAY